MEKLKNITPLCLTYMSHKPSLTTWAAKQSIAILAVSNISPSNFGYSLLKEVDDGLMSYEEAKQAILSRARSYCTQKIGTSDRSS
jgi:hypothetical protein